MSRFWVVASVGRQGNLSCDVVETEQEHTPHKAKEALTSQRENIARVAVLGPFESKDDAERSRYELDGVLAMLTLDTP
ncbi:hypothetical protein V7793_04805 [Streptomyces sp. KLMMK]